MRKVLAERSKHSCLTSVLIETGAYLCYASTRKRYTCQIWQGN